jgi:hypothetical protein
MDVLQNDVFGICQGSQRWENSSTATKNHLHQRQHHKKITTPNRRLNLRQFQVNRG